VLPAAERRRRRRDWRLAGAVAALLLVLSTLEQKLLGFSRSLPIGSDAIFFALVHLNVIAIGVLVFLLARNIGKLVVERRRGILGAKLQTRFVVSFGFVAAVSSAGLFVLSAIVVSRAINVWFQLELSESLGHSLEIADAYYEEAEGSAISFARRIASGIERERLLRGDASADLEAFVAGKRTEYGLGVVEVLTARKDVLARATDPEVAVVSFEAPQSDLVRRALEGAPGSTVDHAGQGELVRGAVPIHSTFDSKAVVAVVVVSRFLPRDVGSSVEAIRAARAAYERLQPSKGTFQSSMVMLLFMITLLALLFSTWLGFRLAKSVTDPIQRLASATSELAAGNLDARVDVRRDDELGQLMTGFNRMATDLSKSREDLERRRALMEVILRSAMAGVLSLDRDGLVSTVNPSTLRLLGASRGDWVGHKIEDFLQGEVLETLRVLLRQVTSGGDAQTVRRQVELVTGEEPRALNWTVSRIHDSEGAPAGFVVVIDDVTQILRAQRMSAWREIARRIAHEIKNPLTPIQLSAQRLRRKLAGKLGDPDDEAMLVRCTDAITNEVEGMKTLLSEFSNFARLPAIDPTPTDLNRLAADTVSMYEEEAHAIAFRTDLAPQLPTLDLDREQMKRVILNLVDNAMAAVEAAGEGPREIVVSTRYEKAVGTVSLEVRDTGTGIRPEDRPRLFDPDFSTKRRGSGLGLAIVSRIVSDHSGYIRVLANRPRGTRFVIELPVRT
jgi:two-component system nitrogen regulation sensor histidine kinase NtrY